MRGEVGYRDAPHRKTYSKELNESDEEDLEGPTINHQRLNNLAR